MRTNFTDEFQQGRVSSPPIHSIPPIPPFHPRKMNVERAQNAREGSPVQAGDWRPSPLCGAVSPLPGSEHASQLPPRAPRTGELGSIHVSSNFNSPSMHSPLQWGQPRAIVRPHGLYQPSQYQPVSQPPQVHQRRPSPGLTGLQNLQSIQQWVDRATLANEKAKSLFSVIGKVCQSKDCSASDVQRLISISFEQLVRNLDCVAAAKALRATTIQDRQWSTEPSWQGFRMAAKEAKGYIDKNSIDPMRSIYSVAKDGSRESRTVHAVAEESVVEQQRATWFRRTAKEAASMADIPLYTELDNFLEKGELQYGIFGEKAVSSGHPRPGVVPQSGQARDGLDASPEIPQVDPPFPIQGHQNTNGGTNPPSNAQRNGDLSPILVKEGHLVSTGTFDRRSHNTWNDLSPRYDGGITNLPWTEYDEILGRAPAMAVMARDVLDDFNLPGASTLMEDPRPTKSVSSPKVKGGPGAVGETAGDSQIHTSKKPGEKSPPSVPSCFCGDTCKRKGSAGGMTYFGCKHSKCPAHIPVPDVAMPNSTNDDSGTLVKLTSEATENPSKKKPKGASSQREIPGGVDAIAKKGRAKSNTKINSRDYSKINSKVKSRGTASPKRKRKGETEVASSPDDPPSPARRLLPTRSATKARAHGRVDIVGPRVAAAGRGPPSPPKPKRPRRRSPLAAAVGSPTKGLIEDRDGAQSIEQMIEEELASLPAELRCRKPDPSEKGRQCLQSLRPGVDGAGPSCHVGRCRYKPRGASQLPCGTSGGPHPCHGASKVRNEDDSDDARRLKSPSDSTVSEDDPAVLVDTRAASRRPESSVMGLDTLRLSGPSGPPPPSVGAAEAEAPEAAQVQEVVDMAIKDVATARDESGKRLSESLNSGKLHWDGQGLLHREFATLSAKKIAASHGCSSILPHSEWNEQKREFLAQREALRAHPMLHAVIVGDTDFGTCDIDPEDAEPPKYREEATGLFAVENMKAGFPVAELVGETISVAEAKRREGEYASLIASDGLALTNIVGDNRGHLEKARGLMFNLNEHWVLDATRAGSSARFARRTKDGNCRLATVKDPAGAMHVYLQAISDLSHAEEITIQSV